MRIVLAPDSFKESMTARQAAEAMERGVLTVLPDAECVLVPLADGGEGTVDTLVGALSGALVETTVDGPLGGPVAAAYGWITAVGPGPVGGPEAGAGLAVLEAAAAVGLGLIPPERRNPMLTSSYGLGQLIRHALDRGASRLIIGLGGTGTNDGGAGMLQALGARLLDRSGQPLPRGAAAVATLARLDLSGLDPRLARIPVEIASDVTNPLLGPAGASTVFGPQKGATPQMVRQLDAALEVLAGHLEQATGRAVAGEPGAGAAGGIAAALLAVVEHVTMRSGIEVVLRAAGLERKLLDADLVLTGEGSVDSQTLAGKTLLGVAGAAKRAGVPVVVLAGQVGPGAKALYQHGVVALVPIVQGVTDLPSALADGARNLELTAATVCRLVRPDDRR
jgi:glycerate kinase